MKIARFDRVLVTMGILLIVLKILFAYVAGIMCNSTWELFSITSGFLVLILLGILFVRIFVRFFKKKSDAVSPLLAFGALLIGLFSFTPPNAPIFLKGFKSFVLSHYSVEVLEQKGANLFTQIPESEVWSDADSSTKQGKELVDIVMKELPEFYKFRIKPHWVSNHGGKFMIIWGGALTGHWGIVYSGNGVKKSPEDFSYIPIGNKVAVTYLTY